MSAEPMSVRPTGPGAATTETARPEADRPGAADAPPAVRDDGQVRRRVAEVEQRLARIESLSDPEARDAALAAVQGVVELYGEALARVVARLGSGETNGAGGADGDPLAALAADELVGHLLLVHELHPRSLEERIAAALDQIRPRLHGARASLVGVEAGAARLSLSGGGSCPSTAEVVRRAVEEAVLAAAPELERVAVETDAAAPAAPAADFVPLASLRRADGGAR